MKKSYLVSLVSIFFVFTSIIFVSCADIEPGDAPSENLESIFDGGEAVGEVDGGEVSVTEMDGGMMDQQVHDHETVSETQTEPIVDGSVQPEPVADIMQQDTVIPEPQPSIFEQNTCTQIGSCGAKPTDECDLTQWKFVIKVPPNCNDCSHKVESWPMGHHTTWEIWHTPYKDGKPVDHFNIILKSTSKFNLAHGISKMCHEHKCIKYQKSKHPDSTYKNVAQPTNWYNDTCFPVGMSTSIKAEDQTWLYYLDWDCYKTIKKPDGTQCISP